jgi:hypothetical protein
MGNTPSPEPAKRRLHWLEETGPAVEWEPRWLGYVAVALFAAYLGYGIGDARSLGEYGRAKEEVDTQRRLIKAFQKERLECSDNHCRNELDSTIATARENLELALTRLEIAR